MAVTSLVDFNPQSIDMIFAVSQQNLNEGLAEYIRGLSSQVSWEFDVDNAGELSPPANPDKPDITFSGTLAPPAQPQSGHPVWIVDLSKAGAANQVVFNLTFQDGAKFTDNQTGHSYTQSVTSGGFQWIVPFDIDLTLNKIKNKKDLPDWLKKRLAVLNGDYGDVFDLSQILLDLDTLVMGTDPTVSRPKDISLYEWTLILQGMSTFLASSSGNVFTQSPSAGYAVTHNGATSTQPLPTYTPTAADFVIVPNSAYDGGASALVFVLMVQNNPLPSTPANAFTNVSLIADPTTIPGVALINSQQFVSFVQSDFESIGLATAINQYVQSVKSDGGGVTWQLASSPDTATSTNQTPSTANSQEFLSFAMPQQTSNASNFFPGGTHSSANSTTDSNASVNFSEFQTNIGYNSISASGTLSMSVSYSNTSPSGSNISWDSPTFKWNWSIYYAIQPVNAQDTQSGGGVQFVLNTKKSVFPTTPVDAGGGDSAWNTVEPSKQDFVTDLLAPVIQALPGTFQSGIQSLASLGNFVFPGGGTFTFRDSAVNSVYALYSTIQYQNPN